jgi:hypothetical protein
MTMDFNAPKGGMPADLKPGDPIAFEFVQSAQGRLRGDEDRAQAREPEVIASIIRWSIGNRFLVLIASALVAAWGLWSLSRTPVDALPDLSDVQVIIRTTYPGQAPRIVEDQVTYPLTTTMMSVPGAKAVRGFLVLRRFVRVRALRGRDRSLLGALARARIPEPGAGAASPAAKPALGPDATGSGPGCTSTPSSIAPAGTTSASCARCRTVSSSTS